MVVANKSAPVSLGIGAIFATTAAILGGRGVTLKARYLRLTRYPITIVATAFILLCILSLTWSIDPSMTRRGLIEGFPELIAGLAIAAAWPLVATSRDFRWLIAGLIAASALIVFERITGMPIHHLTGARAESYDLKRSAIPSALLVWPAVAYCLHRSWLWLGGALVLAAMIEIVASHSGAPGFALGVAVMTFLVALWRPRTATAVTGIILLAMIATSHWTGSLTSSTLPDSAVNALREEHAANRIEIWKAFEARAQDHILLGHGFDTSFDVARTPRPHDQPLEPGNADILDTHPHNIFLQLWVELGLVGAVASAVMVAFTTLQLLRLTAPPAVATRLALLVTVVGIGLVGLSAWQPWWLASIATSLLWFDLLPSRT